jgi:hypothetical protein
VSYNRLDRQVRYAKARDRALHLRETARLISAYCLVRGSSDDLLSGLRELSALDSDWESGIEVEHVFSTLNQCANELLKIGDPKLVPFAEECEILARDLFSLMIECRAQQANAASR